MHIELTAVSMDVLYTVVRPLQEGTAVLTAANLQLQHSQPISTHGGYSIDHAIQHTIQSRLMLGGCSMALLNSSFPLRSPI